MMNLKRFHLFRVVVALAAVGGVTTVARPNVLARAGLDFWCLPTMNEEIETSVAEQEQMESELTALQQRMEIKDQIAFQLADGEIELRRAAMAFRDLYATNPVYLEVLRNQYPEMKDDERICRNVIRYTSALIQGRADRTQILQRLEDELARLQRESRPLAI